MADKTLWWRDAQPGKAVPVLMPDNGDDTHSLGVVFPTAIDPEDRILYMMGADGRNIPVLVKSNADSPRTYRIAIDGVAGPTGPQGPQGIQGEIGATGPQGSPGPSLISTSSAAAPGIPTEALATYGIYANASGHVGISQNGTAAFIATPNGIDITNYIAIGTNPAQTGAIRLQFGANQGIWARNENDTTDVPLVELSTNNTMLIGHATRVNSHVSHVNTGGNYRLGIAGIFVATVSGNGNIALGSNPAQSGQMRFPNNTGLYNRNAANDGDIAAILVDSSDRVSLRDGGVYITTAGLGVGTNNPAFSTGQAVRVTATGDQLPAYVMERVSAVSHTNRSWAFGVATDGRWFVQDVTAGGNRLFVSTAGVFQFQVGAEILGGIGFFGTAAQTKKIVTGSRGGNAALASLLTELAAYGFITNSTSV